MRYSPKYMAAARRRRAKVWADTAWLRFLRSIARAQPSPEELLLETACIAGVVSWEDGDRIRREVLCAG